MLSPDGSQLLFTRRIADGRVATFVRPLDRSVAKLVNGTELPAYTGPTAFSPDGKWIRRPSPTD